MNSSFNDTFEILNPLIFVRLNSVEPFFLKKMSSPLQWKKRGKETNFKKFLKTHQEMIKKKLLNMPLKNAKKRKKITSVINQAILFLRSVYFFRFKTVSNYSIYQICFLNLQTMR